MRCPTLCRLLALAVTPAVTLALVVAPAALAGCGASHGATGGCPKSLRPSARDRFDAILIPDSNAIYVFGGDRAPATQPLGDLWRFSLSGACAAWQALAPSTASPSARAGYSATLDEKRDRILYVGGLDADGNGLVDTWALDPNALQFTQLSTVGTVPPPRGGRAAAYDALADRLLLVGDVAFELDFSGSDQGNWKPIVAAGTPPSPRTDFASAVDPTRSLVVMFGGTLDAGGFTDELWAYDFLINAWRPIASSGSVPTPRAGARMRWDAHDKLLLVYGGSDASGARGELYSIALDGNGRNAVWKQITRAGAQPAPRAEHDLVISGDLLWLFGGLGACGVYDDVWTLPLDGGAWIEVLPRTSC